ncbi:MAG: hypothetical protein AB2L14_34920 [Candidatus Xenobiia bacterium LiM19]
MTIQTQYTLAGSGNSSFPNGAESAVNEEEPIVEDLRDIVSKYEQELSIKKPALEQYKNREHDLEVNNQSLYNRLESMSREDGRLRKAEKAARYLAIPSPITMGLGAAMQSPIVAACGAAMLLSAIALKLYSKKRIETIDRTYSPMQNQYQQNAHDMNSARMMKEKLGSEVCRLETDCTEAKKRVAQAEADISRMSESLASGKPYGAGEIQDFDEYVLIDGMSVKKGGQQ